jgi:photosystem II stability/assembly factor-like uncharacterized protein
MDYPEPRTADIAPIRVEKIKGCAAKQSTLQFQTMVKISRTLISFCFAILVCCGFSFHDTLEAQSRIVQLEKHKPASKIAKREEGSAFERGKYFYDRLTSGTIKDVDSIHNIAANAYQSLNNRAAFKAEMFTTWQPIGTGLNGACSGRVRSVAFDPSHSEVVYIAATVGGVWKTNNIDADPCVWQPLTDQLPSTVCTQIAIPTSSPETIYVGTGETYPGYDASDGRGVFKSTDGGLNWSNVLSANRMGTTCSFVTIDASHESTIFAGGPGHYHDYKHNIDTTKSAGLFRSTDAGATWTKLTPEPQCYPTTIAIDPTNSARVYVGSYYGNCFRSTDGGDTWIKFAPPFTSAVHNPVLAIAPSATNILYAAAANSVNDNSAGICSSSDYGVTWTLVNNMSDPNPESATPEYLVGQGDYGTAIVVDPTDSSTLVVGGRDIYVSADGGVKFQHLSNWFVSTNDPSYSHADVHSLVYSGTRLYCGNDGGLSLLDGYTWYNAQNAGLPTLQFVGIESDKAFTFVLGGTQDNGTDFNSLPGSEWNEVHGGDGGHPWISPLDGGKMLSTYIYTSIYRSGDSGLTWSDVVAPGFDGLVTNQDLLDESAPFYAAYDASPDGSTIAFGGNSHMYISRNSGDDGFALQGKPAIGTIRFVRVSSRDAKKMWAGTDSAIARSTDKGATWKLTRLSEPGQVLGITPGADDKTLYAIIGGISNDSNAHFQKSTDGGATWHTRATNFPRIPSHCLARAKNGALFVGNDYAVITSTDDGLTWSLLGLGMPRVQVYDLKVKGLSDEYLLAGTHGRGAYWLPLIPSGVATNSATNFKLGECTPNPVMHASAAKSSIDLDLTNAANLSLGVFDELGHEIFAIARDHFAPGHHSFSIPVSQLPSGEYFVVLTTAGQGVSRKLTIVR